MKKVSSKSRADNKIGELIVHPSVDGEAHWRRVETMRERTRSKFREGNRIYDDSSSLVERGRVNTRDKRTLLLALQRRETAPGSRARRFWPFALPGSRHGEGGIFSTKDLWTPRQCQYATYSIVEYTLEVHKKCGGGMYTPTILKGKS